MSILVVTFVLATVFVALSVSHIMGSVDGHETTLGLPANSEFVPILIGMVMSLVAAGVLLAPFMYAYQQKAGKRSRRRRQ